MGHGGAADGPPVGRHAPAVPRVAVALDLGGGGRTDGAVSARGGARGFLRAASGHLARGPVVPLTRSQGGKEPGVFAPDAAAAGPWPLSV